MTGDPLTRAEMPPEAAPDPAAVPPQPPQAPMLAPVDASPAAQLCVRLAEQLAQRTLGDAVRAAAETDGIRLADGWVLAPVGAAGTLAWVRQAPRPPA